MSQFQCKVSSLGWLVVMVGTMEFPVFKLNMEQEDEWHDAVKFLTRAIPANLPTKSDTVLYYCHKDKRGDGEGLEIHTIELTEEFLFAITATDNPPNGSALVRSVKRLRQYFGSNPDNHQMNTSLYAAKTIVETLAALHFLPMNHLGNSGAKLGELPTDHCWIEYKGKRIV